jgi:hypothetical protein
MPYSILVPFPSGYYTHLRAMKQEGGEGGRRRSRRRIRV